MALLLLAGLLCSISGLIVEDPGTAAVGDETSPAYYRKDTKSEPAIILGEPLRVRGEEEARNSLGPAFMFKGEYKAGEEVEEMEEGVTAALDMEDMWKKEASTFTPAPTTTMADSNGDVRSMDRKLDSSLRLLTKLQLGKDLHWDLPWTIRYFITNLRNWSSSSFESREAGETMREAAERGLEERFRP